MIRHFTSFMIAATVLLAATPALAAFNPQTWAANPTIPNTSPYPILGYATPAQYGAKCDGTADDTVAIQNWFNALSSNGLIGFLPNSMCNVGIITMHGSTTIEGVGPSSGFNLIGANASFRRDTNISYINWSNFSFIGDGVLADNQYSIFGSSSFSIASATLTNINAENLTNAADLTNIQNAVVVGGQYGPTLGDGTVSGTGYCLAIGSPDGVVRAARISNVLFYRCARHALYGSAGAVISSANNQFVQNRYGLSYTGELASLVMSRGASFSDIGSNFYDCYDSPFGLDNDTTFSHAATAFSMTGETFNNCPFPAFIGADTSPGSALLDNESVSVTDINWHASANDSGEAPIGDAIVVYGCNVCTIGGTFDFFNSPDISGNVEPIVLHNAQNRGPFSLTINANAKIAATGGTNGLIEVGTEQAASSSTAEVFVSPSSHVIGAPLFFPVAEIQNPNIVAPGNTSIKAVTGATPYVAGYVNFTLTQSGATNVTNFLSGYSGQTISVVVGDTNTTFAQGSTLKTLTGSNVVASVASVAYVFKNISGVWYQQ